MVKWQGKWIWCAGEPSPRNSYVYMRRSFDLTKRPKKACLRVCADSRYKLFVNGKLVGRGPARSFPEYQHYDEYRLAPHFRKGRNVIAALVHHYGENTFQYHLGRGAFLLDGEIECDGSSVNISTGSDWKVLRAQAWYQDLPRMDVQLGYQEVYDMNKAPDGWTLPSFDDSAWEEASVIGPVGTPPWKLIPRGIPFLPEYQIYPKTVLQTGAADVSSVELPEGDAMNISLLQSSEALHPDARRPFSNSRLFARRPNVDDLLASRHFNPHGNALSAGRPRRVKPIGVRPAKKGRSSYVVLDFGKEVMGYVTLKIRSNSGGILDMGYSELLENGRVNAHRGGVRYADRVILKPGKVEFETFDKRAFRYMQIDFRDLEGPVVLESVGLRFSTYPAKWRGRFACSDQLLTDIWRMSAYTVQLNMEDAYTDCPWRERAQWMGDARVEALVNYYAFGDTYLASQMLREVAWSQHEDGMTNCFAPGDPGPCDPIPSFCLIWILSLWDWHIFTGRRDLVMELYPNVRKALEWFLSRFNEMGLASHLPYWMFIDWADIDIRGAVTSLNCFLVGALDAGARMAKIAGDHENAACFCAAGADLVDAINAHLWSSDQGAYVDCHCDGEQSKVVSEQANSLAIVFDVSPRGAWESILDRIHSPDSGVVRAGSPYFSFYVLQALWKAGRKKQAIEYIRGKWGDMPARGATTCWEQWNQNHSLCHGWSGGPAADLPAEITGIKPLAPGFTKFAVDPTPLDLEWASASVPTPQGSIDVMWSRSDTFELFTKVPAGTTAIVTMPDAAHPDEVCIAVTQKQAKNVVPQAPDNSRPVYAVRGPAAVGFSYRT